jgi:subtilase family serine protease
MRSCVALFVAVLALNSLGSAQTIGPRNRITSSVVDGDAVTLLGNTHPLARPEFDRGAIAAETQLERMVLVLQPDAAQQSELDELVQAQHTPGSPYYHQWLTPAEYGARFGASASDVTQITAWLESHGFAVEPAGAGRRAIVFSGNAGQVAEAFQTEIHKYMVNGQLHIANSQDPQIPKALAPVVSGMLSLHDFRRQAQISSVRRLAPGQAAGLLPEYTSGTTHYIVPADYGTIYDLNPQYSAGVTGSGVSIAIVGRSDINLSDVSSFRSSFGLPANQPTVIHDGTDPGINDSEGDQDESTLDVEWSGAVGYGATIDFVVAKSTATTDGVDLSAQYIVDNDVAPVMSTSYGACEAEEGSAELAFYNGLLEQAASEGISSFVSAGDSGAAGCNSGSSTKGSVAGVNGLCSSPYSTCVGGTEFNEGSGSYWSGANNSSNSSSALSYIPEKVWNESALDGGSGLWAGGGGVSGVYSQPSWQAGITGSSANGMRTVPDVSLTASSHDGYLLWENGGMVVIAGTSAASPSFAGIMSLVVQKRGGQWQGNANPTLYGLLDAEAYPFHATATGNNSVPGVTGFTANGAAYNLATGLGSVDGNILVNEWPASGTSPQKAVALDPSVSSISIFPGTSTTFTLAVVGSGGYSGTVALKATAPSGVTVSFSPASVKTGASATVTVTAATTAVAGSGNIVISGTSGTYTPVVTEGLTVTAPALTVTPGSSSVTAFQGQSTTFTVAVGAASGFTNAVTLSATAPTGVTVSFSPASVKPGASATATVTTTTSAAAGTGTITVKAASGSATATASEGLTVTLPTLTVSPSVSSLTTYQGQAVTFTVAVGASTGFTNAIVLSATAPSGVTVTFSPASVKSGSSVTATVSASGAATAGAGVIAVKGTAGSAAASLNEPVTVVAPTLTLTVQSATSVSAFQGQTATFTVGVGASSGFINPITLSATAPTGVTVTFSPASVKPGASATATVTASTTATGGTGAIAVKGTAGSSTATLSEGVTVIAPTLTVTPGVSSVSTFQGQTTTFTVAVGATSGFTNAVALTATAPAGVTVSFSPASVKPGASATATVTAATTAAAGTGSITVKGTSGSSTTTVSEGVTVIAPTLTVTPGVSSVSTFQGQTTTFTVTVGATSGFTNAVTLTATAPAGVTVSFSPASVKPGASATATVTASTTATAGTGTIAVKGASGSATVAATEGVTVLAPTLTVTPSSTSLTVARGKTATFTIAVAATSGFTNAVTLKATVPAGATVSFSPASVKPGASATATVSVATSAAVGSATITVTGTSGAASATAAKSLTVQ